MDKVIICQDCGEEFIFTEGEQKFYNEKKLAEPRRCKSCREQRKNNRKEEKNNG